MWNSVKKIFKRKYRFALFMLLLQAVALYCDIKYFPQIYGFSGFVEIMYTSLISFAAMWITCYLLIAQVFKDRYSLKSVENAQLSPMLSQLMDIIVAVLLGAGIIFTGFGLLTPLTYSFLTIVIIIRILKSARDTVKNMMTNTSVDSLFLKAGNEVLKKGELSTELMRDISDTFEECIIKEDNCVVENIITKTEELYKLTYINLIYFCLKNDNHKCIYWILREFYVNVYSVCEDEKKKEDLLELFIFCLYKKNEIKDMRDINNLILHVTETIIRNGKLSFATEDFIREVIINGGEYIQKEFIHLLSRLLNGDMGEAFTDAALSNIKYICINTEEEYIKNEAVKTLHNLADRTDDKKKVFSAILRIASDCVENGYDRALRECFNAMGWIMLESIRCRKVDDAVIEYMFRRTEDIYTAAKSTGASERTVVFMLTLFTTLGMFCYQNFNEYLDIIYKVLRCEKEEKVRVAMKLRLDDNEEWDRFFRNDDENKEAFLKLVYSLNNQH